MQTIVINAGSSSVKFTLYDTKARSEVIILDGVVDRIGTSSGATLEVTHGMKNSPEKNVQKVNVADHREAGKLILSLIRDYDVERVVHRVVHGRRHDKPVKVTADLIEELKTIIVLAPLHMPPAIALIELFEESKISGVVCFDNMFHATMPDVAKTYAIPQDIAFKYGIIRYGFHCMAHESMAYTAAELAGKNLKYLKVITCQLGNGVSLCAIKNGKSIDTSMGFTPLEGLMMGTRSGDIDPAMVPFLVENEKMTVAECRSMLEKNSGLKAVGGASDVRDLLAKEKDGDKNAKLALDLFAYRIRLKMGAYVAALGGVDMIVFGGGISRSSNMRERILHDLDCFGVILDKKANVQGGLPLKLNAGKTLIYVIDVDEQKCMLDLAKHAIFEKE